MTIELGVFDIVLYTLLLCTGTILCYMLPHSVSFRRKSYEAMALDLLEQGKIKDAADIMDCLHWWHFTKEWPPWYTTRPGGSTRQRNTWP